MFASNRDDMVANAMAADWWLGEARSTAVPNTYMIDFKFSNPILI